MQATNEKKTEKTKKTVKATKATKAQAEIIVSEIKRLICDFEKRSEIVRYCAKEYKIKSRQVDCYLQRAHKELQSSLPDSGLHLQYAIQRLKALKEKAMKTNDLKTALGVEKELNKLLLPRSPSVQVTSNVQVNNAMLQDRIKGRLPIKTLLEAYKTLKESGAVDDTYTLEQYLLSQSGE